jgi:hypothetical protein
MIAAPAVRADDSSRQSNKNNWRNGAILGGAAALYGLHNHDTTTTVLGAAGAAYAAHRYEQDRHSQDEAQRARQRARYYRAQRNAAADYDSRYRAARRYHYTTYHAPHRSYYTTYHTTRRYHRTASHATYHRPLRLRRTVTVTREYY